MRQFSILLSLLTVVGCTSGTSPIYVSRLRALDPQTCAPLAEEFITPGFDLIDVAADPQASVFAVLSGGADFFSNQPAQTVGTRTIAPTGRDGVMVQRIVLRYTSKPPIPGLAASVTDTIFKTVTITKESEEAIITVPLFGPNARAKLRSLGASNTDTYQFVSTFEFQGVTTQSNFEFKTGAIPVPMTLVKSEVTCSPEDPRLKRFTTPQTCFSAGVNNRLVGNTALCCNAGIDPATGQPRITAEAGCDILP
ncbi:MAG: hypothetical protein GQE15_40730 [Archangiaceae bacterium]|nr:hypothetical protein [Archangiaceae bacterium]